MKKHLLAVFLIMLPLLSFAEDSSSYIDYRYVKPNATLYDIINSDKYEQIRSFLKSEYSSYTIYPEMDKIFTAFKLTDYYDIKAVILGQDPYHEYGQAQGVSFSVPSGIKIMSSFVLPA